jgi:hypothetical protein
VLLYGRIRGSGHCAWGGTGCLEPGSAAFLRCGLGKYLLGLSRRGVSAPLAGHAVLTGHRTWWGCKRTLSYCSLFCLPLPLPLSLGCHVQACASGLGRGRCQVVLSACGRYGGFSMCSIHGCCSCVRQGVGVVCFTHPDVPLPRPAWLRSAGKVLAGALCRAGSHGWLLALCRLQVLQRCMPWLFWWVSSSLSPLWSLLVQVLAQSAEGGSSC